MNAHFDGQRIALDEPFEIPSNARLLVVLEAPDLERDDWAALSAEQLARAFTVDEPEYPLSALKERDPARTLEHDSSRA